MGSIVLTEGNEKNVLHTLETAVIDWSHQIKDVIKSDSAAALDDGLNPGPYVELNFWAAKAENLKCIHKQLTDGKIQKISQVLLASKSTYYPAFTAIYKETADGKNSSYPSFDCFVALEEASDISTHLRPLKSYVESLNQATEFSEISKVFPPMMHILGLIWTHSKYYNTPSRITVILSEICNDLIDQVRSAHAHSRQKPSFNRKKFSKEKQKRRWSD